MLTLAFQVPVCLANLAKAEAVDSSEVPVDVVADAAESVPAVCLAVAAADAAAVAVLLLHLAVAAVAVA